MTVKHKYKLLSVVLRTEVARRQSGTSTAPVTESKMANIVAFTAGAVSSKHQGVIESLGRF